MFNCLKKKLISLLIIISLTGSTLPLRAEDITDTLPDIGTTAGDTLSINEELQMGDFYLRQLRASAPLIDDPLLSQYINQLGMRLVAHAHSVRTPFHFFLVQSDEVNAFAFFGGNVVLHSALFRMTDNESQLASVMAHEISHVTQRHLARAMEEQKHNAPLTWAGALGSVLLAMANPRAGMAALTGTLAGTQQGVISFTQSNEQEADRIGLQVLQRSGFNPQAMPDFLQKLADQSRFASKPPEILLTHPLPDSRLADTRSRANQMPAVTVASSQDYYLAKARVLGMYPAGQSQLTEELLESWSKGNVREQQAAQYGRILLEVQARHYASAQKLLAPLLSKEPDNVWYLDIMTDIDSGLEQPQRAARRLAAMKASSSNPVLQLNLASAWLAANQPDSASQILNHYTWSHPDDPNGWALMAKAAAARGLRDEELSARAEELALTGKLDQAITALSNAGELVPAGSLKQARYDARIDQLHQLQQRFRRWQKG